jgi:hypothetical protein
MGYIIKNTAGLVNTKLTDTGRKYLSQGNFNISYFQIGDSEVSYNAVPNYNQVNNNILDAAFNAQNDSGSPQSNKQHIKYPYYLAGGQGNTYGIPFMDSQIEEVYNYGGVKGFFTTGDTPQILTSTAYTINANYWLDISTMDGSSTIYIEDSGDDCTVSGGTPSEGDIITIVFNQGGECEDFNQNQILTFKIQSISPSGGGYDVTLDRSSPNFTGLTGDGRVYIYPSGMTQTYDYVTPLNYFQTYYDNICQISEEIDVPIWNMNIPWSESPAGVYSNIYEDYSKYGSVSYIGTKEYLGYQESSGQTDTSQVFYYNSFDEKIVVRPQGQKAIAIIHYTNNSIENVYGEKFSTIPFDPENPTDDIGLAKHFKLSIPTLMWHKSTGTTIGQTFTIDPEGYELCVPYYIKSSRNLDMNDPGIRYFHLWDSNPDSNGNLNRIGKVFPDQQIVIIDDEEVIAAMSYKSNRNWTLPAPKVTLITPNICSPDQSSSQSLITNPTERVYVTYRFDTQSGATSSLHCNYYSVAVADQSVVSDPKNLAVRFGDEFKFLSNTGGITGFTATSMKILCQIVSGDTRPLPNEWREIDVTDLVLTDDGVITSQSITGVTFQIDFEAYDEADSYNLADYIDIPDKESPDVLNFGDEYYFYGNIETDIAATIYEMKYLINLGSNQFTNTSNPTWMSGTTSYVTEIGLFNQNKDLMLISKLQSPQIRQGIQQYVVKFDF